MPPARVEGGNNGRGLPDEDWVRGYPQELADFAACLPTSRQPVCGLDLAMETVKAIYAACLSAEKEMRVELD